MNKNCMWCDKVFEPKRNTKGMYCSIKCSRLGWSNNKKVVRKCAHCNEEFTVFRSSENSKKREAKYCSKEHANKARYFNENFLESSFRFNVKNYSYQVPTERLGRYDNLRRVKTSCDFNHEYYKNGIVDEKTAYVYGIYLTDGYMKYLPKGNHYYESVDLKLTDFDIVNKVNEALSSKQQVKQYANGKYSMTYRIIFYSTKLFNDLAALGCDIYKTQNANYPLIRINLDKHFIRGVFDGDGSWIKRSNRPELNLKFCGNDKLLFGIYKKIFFHLGLKPQKIDYPIDYNSTYKQKTYCSMKYGKQASIIIRDWMYSDSTIYGQRKFNTSHTQLS